MQDLLPTVGGCLSSFAWLVLAADAPCGDVVSEQNELRRGCKQEVGHRSAPRHSVLAPPRALQLRQSCEVHRAVDMACSFACS